MLTYQILDQENIVIIEPMGPLSEADFRQLTTDVDQHLAKTETLKGLLIHATRFPGWESIAAMTRHIRFIQDHHRKIKKIALASDSTLLEIVPALIDHFVSAEVKTFAYDERDKAMEWLRSQP